MKAILNTPQIQKIKLFLRADAKSRAMFLVLPFLLIALNASAQNGLLHFDHISPKDGLSGEVITALCQDRRGFLWIGTNGQGLNRYDGNEVKIWRHNSKDASSLCNDLVWNILEGADGNIWVGTETGVSKLNPYNGSCSNFVNGDASTPMLKSYLFRDNKGFIWSASESGLWRYDANSNKFERIYAPKVACFQASASDRYGRFWLGGSHGLTAYDPKTGIAQCFIPFPNESSGAEKNRTSIKIDHNGNIWVLSWGGGLLRFNPESNTFEQLIWQQNPKLPGFSNIVFDVQESSDGEGKRIFWVVAEHGTFRFPLEAKDFPSLDKPHTLLQISNKDDPSGMQTRQLIHDNQGNLWFGTNNGLYRYKREQENIQVLRWQGEATFGRVSFTKSGDVLVNSEAKTPLLILDSRKHWKKVFTSLPPGTKDGSGEICWSAAKDEEDGLIYAATFHGLVSYEEKSGKTRWYKWNPKDSTGIAGAKVTHVLPIGKGLVLLGIWQTGLQLFNTRSGKSVWNFHDVNKFIWCLKSIGDKIWVGTEYALYTFDPGKRTMKQMTPTEKQTVKYYDVFRDHTGATWAGTNYGFCKVDVQNRCITEKYTVEEGLSGTEVTSIAEDSLGRLWLGTPRGLSVFNPKSRKFYTPNKEILHPGGIWLAPDGKFWLSFANEIRIFNPYLFREPEPSRVYITGLSINEKDTLPDVPFERIKQMRLLPEENALTFAFTAIDLDVFGKTNFRYMLEGLQTEWVHAGKDRRAAFVNLSPGVYTFRVRPEDAGEDPYYDAALQVIVTDYFWQRRWFKTSVIFAVSSFLISLIFMVYARNLRVRNFRLQARLAIQEERYRISRDLHDDLGSGLGAINLLSDIALSKSSNKGLRAEVGKIAESARELSAKVHEIIWAANPKNDSLERMINYFHQYAVTLFGDSAYELNAWIPETIPPLIIAGEHRRALFLAYKEALNNIIRHAQASRVDIQFHCSDTQVEIGIRDNGCGFDNSALGDAGNGLTNMRKRMVDIGGEFRVESGVDGTEVVLSVSL